VDQLKTIPTIYFLLDYASERERVERQSENVRRFERGGKGKKIARLAKRKTLL
jgi:hypothetical protein